MKKITRRGFIKSALALGVLPLGLSAGEKTVHETLREQEVEEGLRLIHITDSHMDLANEESIDALMHKSEYGTLALCSANKPYSLPINFVKVGDALYFHGAKKGRKIDILKENSFASFSIVEAHAMIQSYFSSDEGLACPATQFFKSIIIDGVVEFVEEYEEKVSALSALMQKLQPEGKYKTLSDAAYTKAINATSVYKLIPKETRAKFKFGQHLTQERFEMILSHLKNRAEEMDIQTIDMMQKSRRDNAL